MKLSATPGPLSITKPKLSQPYCEGVKVWEEFASIRMHCQTKLHQLCRFSQPESVKLTESSSVFVLLSSADLDHLIEPPTSKAGGAQASRLLLLVEVVLHSTVGECGNGRACSGQCQYKSNRELQLCLAESLHFQDSCTNLHFDEPWSPSDNSDRCD